MDRVVTNVRAIKRWKMKVDGGHEAVPAAEIVSLYCKISIRQATTRLIALEHVMKTRGAELGLSRLPGHPRMIRMDRVVSLMESVIDHSIGPGVTHENMDIVNAVRCHWEFAFAFLDQRGENDGYVALRIAPVDLARNDGKLEFGKLTVIETIGVMQRAFHYCVFGCENMEIERLESDDLTFLDIADDQRIVYRFAFHHSILSDFTDKFGCIDRSQMTTARLLSVLKTVGMATRFIAWIRHTRDNWKWMAAVESHGDVVVMKE